jgi:hypothetical protein
MRGTCYIDNLQKVRVQLQATEADEKVMALKTIGNAGWEEFIPTVQQIVDNENLAPMVRVQAIFCLRRIAPREPETVSG